MLNDLGDIGTQLTTDGPSPDHVRRRRALLDDFQRLRELFG
jgi:hypothetical protein